MTRPTPPLDTDIAVVGGGLGAVAATLAAARHGRRVLLAAPTARLGGQTTTQLVPALDEHPHVETGGISRSYAAFRDLIRQQYAGLANPGGGWVSRLCFEPAAAERAIEALLSEHLATGRVTVEYGFSPVHAQRHAGRLEALTFQRPGTSHHTAPGRVTVRAEMFLDATEAADLLPLTGAPWVAGSEGSDAYGEPLALPGGPRPEAVQSCTVGFVVEHLPGEDHTEPEPRGYRHLRDSQPFTLEIAGWDERVHRYRMFTPGPDGHPPFWTYRRLWSAAQLGGRDAALINWAGNDYAGSSSLQNPVAAYARAKHLSRAFLHWLRTACPRDDGSGYGYPGLRLAPHLTGTADGYAAEPYLRESRRLLTAHVVNQHDLTPVPGHSRAATFPDAAGLAWYHMDFHARVGHLASAYAPTAPFQVPLSALIAAHPANLLAAAKNLAATQVAASAYRVHHGEWAVGEAAGVLAAHSVTRSRLPATVVADRRELSRLQRRLVDDGIPLAWLLDIPPDERNPLAAPAHLLAAAGGLRGPRTSQLTVNPGSSLTPGETTALQAAASRVTGERRLGDVGAPGTEDRASWGAYVRALGHVIDSTLRLCDSTRPRPLPTS